jgi:hypothetical protein
MIVSNLDKGDISMSCISDIAAERHREFSRGRQPTVRVGRMSGSRGAASEHPPQSPSPLRGFAGDYSTFSAGWRPRLNSSRPCRGGKSTTTCEAAGEQSLLTVHQMTWSSIGATVLHAVAWSLLLLWAASVVVAAEPGEDNSVFNHLVQKGIAVGDKSVKLPGPSMSPQADAKEQTAVVRRISAKKYDYEQFVRKSPVAPFMLDINTVGESGGDRVQRVDLWFVAYGKLAALTDEELLGEIAGSGSRSEQGESKELTDDELRERDLKADSTDDRRESYSRTEAPLLDKVQISGIGHSVSTRTPKSILAASLLDPQFVDDPKYPNRWRPIVREASGKTKLGESHPYAGFGGYCQVVELQEPKGALFFEIHIAINEPHAWFNGENLLRSKLPILMNDNVRTLRRKLAKKDER